MSAAAAAAAAAFVAAAQGDARPAQAEDLTDSLVRRMSVEFILSRSKTRTVNQEHALLPASTKIDRDLESDGAAARRTVAWEDEGTAWGVGAPGGHGRMG
jgi:hypothetical protein